jgi:predicted ATPase/DNA-binding SARP family transcriptional activator
MDYLVLGPLEVRDGQESLPLAGAKQRALLALLLLNANRVVSRDRLIGELWGDEPPATAVTSLQVYVSRLRKLLPAETLLTRPPGYLLAVEPDELDLRRFERLLAEGHEALAGGDAERAAVVLHEALELWRGPALAEFAFEPFAQAEIGRLEDLRLSAVEERIEADLALGRHADLIGELEALIAENPHRERLRGQLILALYRSGRQAEALEAYQQARRALDDLGIEPSEELQHLEKQILTHDPVLAAAPISSPRNRNNLPAQTSPLVGRERELTEVLELVEPNRLVTLTGAGGSGKTRLALQAAAHLLGDFPDGVWFVSLAAVTDPELVEPSIAQILGAPRELDEFLQGRQLLLLLDNLEQLLPGVAPTIARLDTNVLATSRERLNVTGEQEYPVPPLPLDDAVALFTQRARQLQPAFEADEHAAEIARRLDGLPLALELAAARVNVLSAGAILERLDKRLPLLTGGARDAPARQRTLRATIDWSHELLTTEEQGLFARLAVFAGGCTLDAAEQVCAAELDTLASLVDKNLLLHHGDRYSMLETIREYAGEKLETSADGDALRRRHAEHFLALAERAERILHGEEIPRADVADEQDVVRELPNLRAALEWAFDQGNVELALRLAAAAALGWSLSGAYAEGWAWVGRALEQTDHLQTRERAKVLRQAAVFAQAQGDYRSSEAFYERARTLFEQQRDQRGVIRSLIGLTNGALHVGDLQRARNTLEEAGKLADELGTDYDRAEVCFSGAMLESLCGHHEQALALLEEGVRLARRHGMPRRLWIHNLISVGYIALQQHDFARAREALEEYLAEDADKSPVGIANAHGNLGLVSLYEANHEEAAVHFRQALILGGEAGAKRTIAEALFGLAAVAAIDGDGERSACLWGAADAILESMGSPLSAPEQFVVEHYLESARAALADDVHLRARAEGSSMSLDEVLTYALEQDNSAARPLTKGRLVRGRPDKRESR